MNRFRRKSESRSRRKEASNGSNSQREPSSDDSPAPTLLLPEPSNFRTSLILPHLTKRFSLLRDSEGRLVDLSTLQGHLAAQRKTGMLSDEEANAVLAQFALERSQQPSSPPQPSTDGDEADESSRESYLSISTNDHTSASFRGGATFHASTFGVPFPHSPDSTASTTGSFSPPLGSTGSNSGGNSMFGGRVQTMAQMKMSKSTSSIHSATGSLKRSGSERTIAGDEESVRSDEGASPPTSLKGKGKEQDEEEDKEEDTTDSLGSIKEARLSVVPSLSDHQLKRISRALDGIELDLSKTFARIGLDETPDTTASLDAVPLSPASPTSDTEAMDPHYHHLAPSPGPSSLNLDSRRPSVASSLASARASATTSPALSSSSPKPDYPSPSLPPSSPLPATPLPKIEEPNAESQDEMDTGGASESEVEGAEEARSAQGEAAEEDDAQEEQEAPLPSFDLPSSTDDESIDTTAPPTPIPLTSPPLTLPYLDPIPSTPRETRSREISSSSTECTISPLSPVSHASLKTPSRSELDHFGSTEGPVHMEDEENEDQLEVVEGRSISSTNASSKHKRSASSIDSTGSSYHAAVEEPSTDTEDLLDTLPPVASTSSPSSSPNLSSLKVISSPPTTTEAAFPNPDIDAQDDEHLSVAAESMSRRPSSPSLGEADLALEDLLMIQETLVRSASRRAAARNSPFDENEAGVRRGSEGYEWSRKGSLEGSGSDGRRGSESDGQGAGRRGSGSDERRGSGSDGRRGSGAEGKRASNGDGGERAMGSYGWRWRRRSSGLESGLSPYRSSRATGTSTSATGSSPRTNGAPTPSTTQSDAFEFSSLVGSPESGSWQEHKEHLASPRELEETSPLVNGDDSPSQFDSPQFESPVPDTFHSPSSQAAVSEEAEQTDEVKRTTEATDVQDEPTKVDPDSFLRVPRKPMAPRDPSNTQSMLIRDVRNQATLATIALKKAGPSKSPTSPVIRSKSLSKSKSIRKGSISSPQLVSGTSDIPAVPILNPDIPPSPLMSPKSPGRTNSSRKPKGGNDAEGKSRGIGMRFKSLLNKKSRDQLPHLNGDEITPFVDYDPESTLSPPFNTSQFSTPDHSVTPEPTEPAPEGRRSVDQLRTRSPGGLPIVAESPEAEHGSPSGLSNSSGNSNKRSLTRLLSRARGAPNRPRRESESTLVVGSDGPRSVASTPEPSSAGGSPLARTYSPGGSIGRRPSIEQEVFGLGIGPVHTDTSSRAPISYDIGAMRRRMGSDASSGGSHEYSNMPQTAPLAVQPLRTGAPEPLNLQHFSFPAATQSAPLPGHRPPSSATRHQHSGSRTSITSVDSMRRLREAAEDLGLPRDKVEELVNLSYAQSPTTSSHAHSGSTSSTLGRRSQDGHDLTTQQRKASLSSLSNSTRDHRRGPSNASASGSGRPRASSSGSRSIADRVPTPPPSAREHRRQASRELHSTETEAVPEVPGGLRVDTIAGFGGLRPPRPPLSPSASSFRSSGYAGSVFDLYGSEDSEGERRPSQDGEEQEDEEGEVVLAHGGAVSLDSPGQEGPRLDVEEQEDGSLVWRVVDDLRRTSTASSRSDSFGFDSRPSSLQSDAPDPLAALLRHHRRNRSSASIPAPNPRYPSVYIRDEKRLVELGREGGVAAGEEEEGHFLVRPREEQMPVVENEGRV
ncbi:hypothetical protein BCR35DRAFT_309288 [Leucosporidium creatinivorum]|uniref:Uncharacterized protein n=1 Tax=Leucosporidium creatinivorum TaxID=106004 RepID=A0A1Y2DJJ0_9BASI|nr:hypothetical protein BCR35DRAFT_309288 [Leucosporidium creatinivorum]